MFFNIFQPILDTVTATGQTIQEQLKQNAENDRLAFVCLAILAIMVVKSGKW